MRGRDRLPALLAFVAPLGLLLLVWAAALRLYPAAARSFPPIEDVARAGAQGLRDGSLLHHAGQSLLRVAVGATLRGRGERAPSASS